VTTSPGRTLRATAALALAGFGVHQARYALLPPAHGETGHAYLHAVAPVLLALLVALALGRSLTGLAGGRSRVIDASPVVRWLASSAALVVLHAAQEGTERALSGGGALDPGALVALPLCLAAGALVALTLRHADELLAAAAPAPRAPRTVLVVALSVLLPEAPAVPRPRALGARCAGRAPPAFG
jgi:hypothetical protein